MITTFRYKDLYLLSAATISGPREKEGPLGKFIDYSFEDLMAGTDSYEKGESKMIDAAIRLAIQKAHLQLKDIEIIVGGDLTNQIASSNEALMNYPCSFVGVYGACSTSMLSLIVASNFVSSKMVENAVCFTSSNFGSAERQFRYPTEYGVKKKETGTTTVTGSGAVIVTNYPTKIQVLSGTIGRVENVNWNDTNDMGSAMSYAAYSTILNHLKNTKTTFQDYDLILTGDLSEVGSKVLKELFEEDGIIVNNLEDAGNLIYNKTTQKDIYAGGSGCACLAITAYGYILNQMIEKKYRDVLLVGTGCLHSKISASQKEKIPVVAHAVHLRRI